MKRFFFMAGKSMKPSMSSFSLVWVVKTDTYLIGDIVVYSRKKNRTAYCHRIIGKDENGNCLIKGDNDPQTDVVPYSNIYYKVDSWRNIF